MHVPGVTDDATFSGSAAIHSWWGVPFQSSNQIPGLLTVCHMEPGYFSQEQLRLASSLAIPAAAAIQNSRLYKQTENLWKPKTPLVK